MSACSLTYCQRCLPSIEPYALPVAGSGQPVYTGADCPVCAAACARSSRAHRTTATATRPTKIDSAVTLGLLIEIGIEGGMDTRGRLYGGCQADLASHGWRRRTAPPPYVVRRAPVTGYAARPSASARSLACTFANT